MRKRGLVQIVSALVAAVALLAPSLAQGAVGPVPDVKSTWSDTNLPPGGVGVFSLRMRNVGDEAFSAPLTLTDQLPSGVSAADIRSRVVEINATFPRPAGPLGVNPARFCSEVGAVTMTCRAKIDLSDLCTGQGTELVTCQIPMGVSGIEETYEEKDEETGEIKGTMVLSGGSAPVLSVLGSAPGLKFESTSPYRDAGYSPEPTGWLPPILIDVEVSASAAGSSPNTATLEGGGASLVASDVDQIAFDLENLGFGFVPDSFEGDVFDAPYPFGQRVRQAGGLAPKC